MGYVGPTPSIAKTQGGEKDIHWLAVYTFTEKFGLTYKNVYEPKHLTLLLFSFLAKTLNQENSCALCDLTPCFYVKK